MGKRPGALNSGKEVYLIALLDSKDDNARAAVDYLVYRFQREIGSLATAMEGIDALLIPTPEGSVLAKGTEQVLQDRANHNR